MDWKVDVVTLFPKMFEGPFSESLLGRAEKKGTEKVDDRPFGGGAGMVLKPEPLYRAIKALGGMKKGSAKPWVIYLSPQGEKLEQTVAERLAKKKHLILICGHYEGIDERVMKWIDQEVSIGDYVLTGGELPAMVLVDAVARLVPGVVGDPESVVQESFSSGLLDYPHYTRPSEWRGEKVPPVLLTGDHKKVAEWRKKEALRQTAKKRPELMKFSK
jgi:tRNA (guanine37-N1)-methyltransferase